LCCFIQVCSSNLYTIADIDVSVSDTNTRQYQRVDNTVYVSQNRCKHILYVCVNFICCCTADPTEPSDDPKPGDTSNNCKFIHTQALVAVTLV